MYVITRGAATGIVVCWFATRGRAAARGYSSPLVCLSVCLFVMSISTHLDAIALRLQHIIISFTQQYQISMLLKLRCLAKSLNLQVAASKLHTAFI